MLLLRANSGRLPCQWHGVWSEIDKFRVSEGAGAEDVGGARGEVGGWVAECVSE